MGCGAQCWSSPSHPSRGSRVLAHLSKLWQTPGSLTVGPCPSPSACAAVSLCRYPRYGTPTSAPAVRALEDGRRTPELGELRISPNFSPQHCLPGARSRTLPC
ncbi:uncharacterized protein LOC143644661 [Tamandua tetradactyla]|uniref:uncharacterized protein LOC143644661 n=1 Tax=Tamandua tetradactyla TaxID=48850 RepID=UPI004053F963